MGYFRDFFFFFFPTPLKTKLVIVTHGLLLLIKLSPKSPVHYSLVYKIYITNILLFRLGREIYSIPTTINLEQLFISILNSIKNEIDNCYSFCCFVLVNKDNLFRRRKRGTRGPSPLALTSAQSRIELMGQRLSLAKLYKEMPSMPNCGPNH